MSLNDPYAILPANVVNDLTGVLESIEGFGQIIPGQPGRGPGLVYDDGQKPVAARTGLTSALT